ncbi:hypothetical protein AOA59_05465 [Pseudomonas sp. 2822-15]|nr:hypothetical protein AOA59_05465 [Pseudomonas sp. 2822-15]
MLHRNPITNLVEIEWLIKGGPAVSFPLVKVIEDGKKFVCIRITRAVAGECPKSPSPSRLKLAELIKGHFSSLQVG